MLAPVRVTWH